MNAYIAPGILENKKLTEAEVIDLIITETCYHYKILPDEVLCKSYKRGISKIRNVIRYLLHKHTSLTLEKIGEVAHSGEPVLHTTVMYSIKIVKGFLRVNDASAEDVRNLDALITIKIRK